MSIEPILAQASTAVLLSWWQAILMAVPFLGWGWIVAKLEKDARYFHFNHLMWNSVHLIAGAAALAAMLLIPIFWISWPVGLILLVGPLVAYWQIRNKAVPESKQFKLSSEGLTAKLEARRNARAARDVLLKFLDSKGELRRPPAKEDPQHQVHMLAEDVFGPALSDRASRVELVVNPKGCAVSQMIDGVRYKRDPIAVEPAIRLIDFVKSLAGLDVEDRRREQMGAFSVSGSNGSVPIHVVTSGSSNGQVLRVDFDRANRLNKPFDALGFLSAQMEILRAVLEPQERHGIILLGAPSGHGLSTTAYSLLNRHDAYTSNIKTLERDIQVELDGVDQVHFDSRNPHIDYATNLQSLLRRDPDVILAMDVIDSETAKVAAEPGLTGPLIYIPQQVGRIDEHLRHWVKLVGDVKLASKPLRLVINQRLLRSLCPNCRQGYQPSPEQLRKLNIPAGKVSQFYRASGKVQVKNKIESCPVCSGSGYLGQTAAFEVMVVDDEARKLLASGDLKAVMAAARRNKMIYLQEAALAKVLSGETTIEEVIRVTAPKAAAAKSAADPNPAAAV